MKILSFLDSIELNQLRLNMGADLVEKIDRGFYSTPLDLVSYKKVSNNFKNPNNTKKISISLKSQSLYSKDSSNPKIFHPIQEKKK